MVCVRAHALSPRRVPVALANPPPRLRVPVLAGIHQAEDWAINLTNKKQLLRDCRASLGDAVTYVPFKGRWLGTRCHRPAVPA